MKTTVQKMWRSFLRSGCQGNARLIFFCVLSDLLEMITTFQILLCQLIPLEKNCWTTNRDTVNKEMGNKGINNYAGADLNIQTIF